MVNRYIVMSIVAMTFSVAHAEEITFRDSVELPAIEFDRQKVKIHTQGLYVNDEAFLVTGRLETKPKRPLLIRVSRPKPSEYEILDLAPFVKRALGKIKNVAASLDHPGGFDRDASGLFWIPVSTSHRRGPTVILGLKITGESLPNVTVAKSFTFDDHIGAVCCTGDETLLAANWDTKKLYEISTANGKLKKSHTWETYSPSLGIELAIQDWKFDAKRNAIIAGGIDKSPGQNDDSSKAVVAVIGMKDHSAHVVRIGTRKNVARPVTNEGLAVFGDELFLLPEDFGRGAKVLRYSFGQ